MVERRAKKKLNRAFAVVVAALHVVAVVPSICLMKEPTYWPGDNLSRAIQITAELSPGATNVTVGIFV